MTSSTPEDLFRVEKERSQSERGSTHAQLLAEAKAAFDKLMAEGQAARKSGRPRKNPLPPLRAAVPVTPAKPTTTAAVKGAKKGAAKKPNTKSEARKATPKKAVRKSVPKKAATKSVARKAARKPASGKPVSKKAARHAKRR